MQLGIGKRVFPGWASALTLTRAHGGEAFGHVSDAVKAPTTATRLDAAVRAMTSFDHVIDNAGKLPIRWLVPNSSLMLLGYHAAKEAVTLLISSGIVPGARDRVGRQALLAAKDTFMAGLAASDSDHASRYGIKLASGWLRATAEDARTGALMLPRDSAAPKELRSGIAQARNIVASGGQLDMPLISNVLHQFKQAGAEFDKRIEAAVPERISLSPAEQEAVLTRSLALLEQAATAGRDMMAQMPADSIVDGEASR